MYISQLIRFALVCSHVEDLNARNRCLTAKLIKQGYRYHKLRKAFPSSIADTMNLFQNSMSDQKSLLHHGLSEPEFYGDSVQIQKDYGVLIFLISFEKY